MIATMLLFQTATVDITPPLSLRLLPSERCAAARPDEIVVCAKDRPERYRLRAPQDGERAAEPMLPKAEMRVFGNGTLSVEGEQAACRRAPSAIGR